MLRANSYNTLSYLFFLKAKCKPDDTFWKTFYLSWIFISLIISIVTKNFGKL
jgi:hypothetical protein